MMTLPDRSRNADAFTPLAVEINGWPDRPRVGVRPWTDALAGWSQACAAFSNVYKPGAGADRTGKGGRRRSRLSMAGLSVPSSAFRLIADS